jgi:hypothetical protein
MSYHYDLLLEIIKEWDDVQLDGYIHLQEERLEHTRRLIRSLKELQRRRNKRSRRPLDTGVRGGK